MAASIRATLGACGYDDWTLERLLRRDGSGLRHDVGPLRTAQVGCWSKGGRKERRDLVMTGKMAPEGRQWAAARRGAAEDSAGGLLE